jgi:hypothetical protein
MSIEKLMFRRSLKAVEPGTAGAHRHAEVFARHLAMPPRKAGGKNPRRVRAQRKWQGYGESNPGLMTENLL